MLQEKTVLNYLLRTVERWKTSCGGVALLSTVVKSTSPTCDNLGLDALFNIIWHNFQRANNPIIFMVD